MFYYWFRSWLTSIYSFIYGDTFCINHSLHINDTIGIYILSHTFFYIISYYNIYKRLSYTTFGIWKINLFRYHLQLLRAFHYNNKRVQNFSIGTAQFFRMGLGLCNGYFMAILWLKENILYPNEKNVVYSNYKCNIYIYRITILNTNYFT